ncbi:MAG: hypothetical protein ACLSU2_02115 [Oscillospiraceae bacterium]
MDARKHLIIIKGKDQTDSVASFQFLGDKCEIAYTSAPNKSYSFQSSNVKILPLQKKIDPAQVIVAANGQTISELMSFSTSVGIIVLSATERKIYHFVGMKCSSSKIVWRTVKISRHFNISRKLLQQSVW